MKEQQERDPLTTAGAGQHAFTHTPSTANTRPSTTAETTPVLTSTMSSVRRGEAAVGSSSRRRAGRVSERWEERAMTFGEHYVVKNTFIHTGPFAASCGRRSRSADTYYDQPLTHCVHLTPSSNRPPAVPANASSVPRVLPTQSHTNTHSYAHHRPVSRVGRSMSSLGVGGGGSGGSVCVGVIGEGEGYGAHSTRCPSESGEDARHAAILFDVSRQPLEANIPNTISLRTLPLNIPLPPNHPPPPPYPPSNVQYLTQLSQPQTQTQAQAHPSPISPPPTSAPPDMSSLQIYHAQQQQASSSSNMTPVILQRALGPNEVPTVTMPMAQAMQLISTAPLPSLPPHLPLPLPLHIETPPPDCLPPSYDLSPISPSPDPSPSQSPPAASSVSCSISLSASPTASASPQAADMDTHIHTHAHTRIHEHMFLERSFSEVLMGNCGGGTATSTEATPMASPTAQSTHSYSPTSFAQFSSKKGHHHGDKERDREHRGGEKEGKEGRGVRRARGDREYRERDRDRGDRDRDRERERGAGRGLRAYGGGGGGGREGRRAGHRDRDRDRDGREHRNINGSEEIRDRDRDRDRGDRDRDRVGHYHPQPTGPYLGGMTHYPDDIIANTFDSSYNQDDTPTSEQPQHYSHGSNHRQGTPPPKDDCKTPQEHSPFTDQFNNHSSVRILKHHTSTRSSSGKPDKHSTYPSSSTSSERPERGERGEHRDRDRDRDGGRRKTYSFRGIGGGR
ncbi:unnamed protein product [Vitrella brassicaformis CCMP3155]|uniref:Uncharacterized protein n=1 Tax=Vitrella brassicaformis (strain CCMP3155) TaxID=1169540 RepID=A0A0G4EQU7_VITBC|nr:unnamed protein product [Vitrella brassicaformis CCMP3155]|eukprot:CEL99815.1 unnamed protein product [Vitrella brassicaformis CCMP3155]